MYLTIAVGIFNLKKKKKKKKKKRKKKQKHEQMDVGHFLPGSLAMYFSSWGWVIIR